MQEGRKSSMASFKLSNEILDRLDKYSKETGTTKTFAVEKALEAYLSRYYDNRAREALEKNSLEGGCE